jgi:hypothetical protein
VSFGSHIVQAFGSKLVVKIDSFVPHGRNQNLVKRLHAFVLVKHGFRRCAIWSLTNELI